MINPFKALAKLIRLRIGLPYVHRANFARDRAEWIDAVVDYRRGLEWLPWREDLKVQIGNCLKEHGDYHGAVKAYSAVRDGASRPEALKQIGDASRRAGTDILPYATADHPDMLAAGVAALTLLPPLTARMLPNRVSVETLEPRRWLGGLGRDANQKVRGRGNNYPSIMLDQVGALAMVRNGALEPLFAGVVAVRARIFSPQRLDTVELWLGEEGDAVRVATPSVRLVDRGVVPVKLYILNAWIDAARLPAGRRWLSIRAGGPGALATGLFVNIADGAGLGADLSSSNAFIPSLPAGAADPDRAIAAAPAEARPAARSLFDRPIRSILAMRVDQLGDVAASLPALARLRALFPEASLTVLVQPAVVEVIAASALADRVLTLELVYNAETERRHLAPAEEDRVRALLAAERFDLAIDLCSGDETRPLLLLTGALYLVGFNADRFTFLDFGIGLRSRDKVNQLERLSHAAAVLSLVEALAVAAAPGRAVVPRAADSAAALAAHRLDPHGYVVLHTGARHAINRWPIAHFLDLAEHIVAETDLIVVMFCPAGEVGARPALRDSDRVRVCGLIDGDAFDAIVSNARVLVGNDSGPKHLAAARGVATVSIHVGRLNWSEWGQDGRGTILSKRVPCTGCGLNDIELCGRDAVCVRSIGVAEVMAAVRGHL